MINNVIPQFMCPINFNWEIVKDVISAIGDICLFFISVYTFRLTIYPKKLKFIGYSCNSTLFFGKSFEITLENRSLCPVVVRSVDLIIDNNLINIFKGNCIIEKFRVETIKIAPYSKIVSGNGKEIDINKIFTQEFSLIIETSRGYQNIKYERNSSLRSFLGKKQKEKHIKAMIYRNKFNDQVIDTDVEYALTYIDNKQTLKTIFILPNGIMSDAVFGYNGLPKEYMCNEAVLRKHFDKEFSKYGLSYSLRKIESSFKSN